MLFRIRYNMDQILAEASAVDRRFSTDRGIVLFPSHSQEQV